MATGRDLKNADLPPIAPRVRKMNLPAWHRAARGGQPLGPFHHGDPPARKQVREAKVGEVFAGIQPEEINMIQAGRASMPSHHDEGGRMNPPGIQAKPGGDPLDQASLSGAHLAKQEDHVPLVQAPGQLTTESPGLPG